MIRMLSMSMLSMGLIAAGGMDEKGKLEALSGVYGSPSVESWYGGSGTRLEYDREVDISTTGCAADRRPKALLTPVVKQ